MKQPAIEQKILYSFSGVLLLLLCLGGTPGLSGCAQCRRDADCQGNRSCLQGHCVITNEISPHEPPPLPDNPPGESSKGCSLYGETRSCYEGEAKTKGVGLCRAGKQQCDGQRWGPCTGQVLPQVEKCDGLDNNCNGQTDEEDPQIGQPCTLSQLPPECAQGKKVCQGARLVCQPLRPCTGCTQDKDCAPTKRCQQGKCRFQIITWQKGYRWANDQMASSCKEYRHPSSDDYSSAQQNAVYWLQPPGDPPYRAYCEMSLDGGGWTLALKADGRQETFRYKSPHWTSRTPYNADFPSLDGAEARLASFSTVPFTQILVMMRPSLQAPLRHLILTQKGSSLLDLFSSNNEIHFSPAPGRQAWKKLIGGGSLQLNCNLEGINILRKDGHMKGVRLGIVANGTQDCNTPDSFIGLGSSNCSDGGTCRTMASSGNYSAATGDNGAINTAFWAYLLVR